MIPHIKYLWYLIRHKWYVFLECIRFRIPLRGLIHDWSKFLPCEWMPYTLSFYGPWKYKDRPQWLIDAFDRAWLHHIHRNPHHWQHWLLVQDDDENKILPMADEDAIEMVCDWRAMSRAQGWVFYGGKAIDWYEKHEGTIQLASSTRAFVEELLYETSDPIQRKETEMPNELNVQSVRDRMKGLMDHAEKTHASARNIASYLEMATEASEEKPDAEAGPIGLIFSRIESVHGILSRLDETLARILAELGRL